MRVSILALIAICFLSRVPVERQGKVVKVVDGDLRRVEKPKPKNRRHLVQYNRMVNSIAEKLRSGQRITNEQVRLALKEALSEESPNKEV